MVQADRITEGLSTVERDEYEAILRRSVFLTTLQSAWKVNYRTLNLPEIN